MIERFKLGHNVDRNRQDKRAQAGPYNSDEI